MSPVSMSEVQQVVPKADSLIVETVQTAAKAPGSSFYLPQLDGLRALAFLLVFGHHAGSFFPETFVSPFKELVSAYDSVIQFGWCGVDLFFVLSAFLITSLLLKEEEQSSKISLGHFYLRRILRIWPMYFLVILVGMATIPFVDPAVVAGGIRPGTAIFQSYIQANLLWSLSFLLNLGMAWGRAFPPAGITPLWSVSLEEQFYLVWPILLIAIKPTKARVALIIGLLVATITYRNYVMSIDHHSHVGYYVNTFCRLDPLTLGALVAIAFNKLRPLFSNQKFGLVCLIMSATTLFTAGYTNSRMFEDQSPFALTLFDAGCALFLLSMLSYRPLIKVFSVKLVGAFGRLTYGMYAIHALVLNTIYNAYVKPSGVAFPSNQSDAIGLFLGLPITFVLALVIWKCYESRFYNLKHKFAKIKSGFNTVS